MAEKIKRTHAERDALLSKVFDSTLQTKDIEITEAGTMEIVADEGFFALKKVNLNVNVQGGGGSSIEYLDVSGLGDTNEILRNALVLFADIVKSKNEEGTFVGVCLCGIQLLFGATTNNATTCMAVAVDLSRHIKGKGNGGEIASSIAEILIMMTSASQEQLDSIPRLTKEEFYAL